MLLVARGDRRMRWCLLLGVLAWLPASVVYFSERYAYLPSVAWAGAVALLLARLAPVRHGGWLMVAVAGALIGLQGTRLRQELARKSEPRTTTALAQAVVDALPIPPADRQIQVLHLPADWVHAQFLEAQLRAIYRDAGLSVCVLSPQSFGLARIHTEGDRDLLVEGVGAPLLDRGHADLAWRELRRGARYLGPGFEVEILDGDGVRCSALRYRFDAPRPGATLLQFEPPAQAQQGRARWIRAGRFVVHRLW
jgi:hypothetical protein